MFARKNIQKNKRKCPSLLVWHTSPSVLIVLPSAPGRRVLSSLWSSRRHWGSQGYRAQGVEKKIHHLQALNRFWEVRWVANIRWTCVLLIFLDVLRSYGYFFRWKMLFFCNRTCLEVQRLLLVQWTSMFSGRRYNLGCRFPLPGFRSPTHLPLGRVSHTNHRFQVPSGPPSPPPTPSHLWPTQSADFSQVGAVGWFGG